MEDYQKRVVVEKEELDKKREKLKIFMKTRRFSELIGRERFLLVKQTRLMEEYSQVLADRVATFG